MTSRTRILQIFILLTAGALLLTFAAKEAQAEPIIVDDDGGSHADFTTIQDAVNESSDGDIIFVYNGTYHENVVIDTTVTLIGNGSTNTTIDGEGVGDVVKIEADWVNLSGFTIMGNEESTSACMKIDSHHNHINGTNCSGNANDAFGIFLYHSSNTCLSNITWSTRFSVGRGIHLLSSTNCTLLDNADGITIYGGNGNVLRNNRDSIYLRNSHRNYLVHNSCDITLQEAHSNTISNNSGSSIALQSSHHNLLASNTVSNMMYSGISLESSRNNTLTNNSVVNTTEGFSVIGGQTSCYNHIDVSNTIEGRPIHYYINMSNIEINATMDVGFLGFINCNNITVRDLNLSNNGQGLLLVNITDATVTNNNFTGNEYGIYMRGSSHNATVTNNNFTGNEYGIYMYNDCDYNSIHDNTVHNNRYGVSVREGGSYNSIENNSISNNSLKGIEIFCGTSDCYFNTIANNTISGNGGDGIILNEEVYPYVLKHSLVTHNTITGNGRGVNLKGWYYGLKYNRIQYNTISRNRDGVYLYKVHENIISKNTISHNNRSGIYANLFSEGNTITYNNIYGNEEYGVYAVEEVGIGVEKSYWGHWTGPYNPTYNPGGEGDRISDKVVVFRPWLPEPWPPKKDFSVSSANVAFPYLMPTPTRINLTLFNTGPENGTDVLADVYVNDELLSTESIDLISNQTSYLSIPWIPERVGLNEITVEIDPENRFLEVDEGNNVITHEAFIFGKYFFNCSVEEERKPVLPTRPEAFSFTITGTGWENDSYFLETACPGNWQADPEDNVIFIPSNETNEIAITVLAPPGALAKEEKTITVIVHSAGNTSLIKTVRFTAVVQQAYGFESWVKYPEQFMPNAESSINLTITNLGNGNDNFTIILESLPDGWHSDRNETPVSIPAFSDDTIEFLITPSADARAGAYFINFSVESGGGGGQQNHTIEIELLRDYSISYSGETEKGGMAGWVVEYEFTIFNEGNTDDLIFITTENADVDKRTLSIPWSGSDTLTALAEIPGKAYPGEIIYSNITLFYGEDKILEIPLTTTVLETHEISMNLPSSVEVALGIATQVEVVLFNNGNVLEVLTLNSTATPGLELEFSQAENISIPAFSQSKIWMNITVPNQKEYAGKDLECSLQLGDILMPMVVKTGEYHEITLEDRGFVNHENGISYYALGVKNNGTVEEVVVLEILSPDGFDSSLSLSAVIISSDSYADISIRIQKTDETSPTTSFDIVLSARYGVLSKREVTTTITIENTSPRADFTLTPKKGRLIFTPTGSIDPDGTIVRYVWTSSIDGEIYNGTEAEFEISNLSAGTHIISLTVQDNYGIWSEESFTTMTVEKEEKEGVSGVVVGLGVVIVLLIALLLTARSWYSLVEKKK